MADDTQKTATVRLRVEGNDRVRRAMNGLVNETKAAQRSMREERKKTLAEEKRASAEEVRSAQKAERAKAEAAKKASRDASREAELAARKQMDLQRRVGQAFARSINEMAQHRRREAEQARKEEERQLRATRRGRALAIAGGIAGAAMGAAAAGTRAQGVLGVRSQEEIVTSSLDLRRNWIRAGRAGGLDRGQQRDMFQRAISIGQQSGISPQQVIEAITMAQENFSAVGDAVAGGPQAIEAFLGGIERMAQYSNATGSELSDVVNAGYAFQRQLGLSASETQDALALIIKGAQDGSLSMRDFAQEFPGLIAGYASSRGSEGNGVEAVAEFAALAQALKASDVGSAEARTLMQNLMSAFGNTENMRRIEQLGGVRRAGIRLTEVERDAEGNVVKDARGREVRRMRNVGDIMRDLASVDDAGLRGTAINQLIHDQQGRQAMVALLNKERESVAGGGPSLLQSLQYNAEDVPGMLARPGMMDAAVPTGLTLQGAIDAGNALVDVTNQDLVSDESGQAVQMQVDREARILGDSGALIEQFASIAGPLTALQDRFPLLTQAVKDLTGVISGAGVGAGIMGALGGSAASGGLVAKALGMMGLGGASAAGAGGAAAGGGAAALALPVLGAAGVGAGIGTLISQAFGEDIDNWIADATGLSEQLGPRQNFRGLVDPNAAPTSSASTPSSSAASPAGSAPATVRIAPDNIEQLGRSIARNTSTPGAGRRAEGSPGGR